LLFSGYGPIKPAALNETLVVDGNQGLLSMLVFWMVKRQVKKHGSVW
jgi:hypothetical protein